MAASTVTEQKIDRDEPAAASLYLVVLGPNLAVTHRLRPERPCSWDGRRMRPSAC